MKLRIAMVAACPFPAPQGSQILFRDTALALRARGHEVHLVSYGHGAGEDDTGLPLHRGPRIPFVRKTAAGPSTAKPLLDLALAVTVRRVCRSHQIDIVHAHNYEGLLVALAARVHPIVYHAHNAMEDELPYYFKGAKTAARFGRYLDRSFPRRADAVIAPHSMLAEHLVGCGCRPEHVSVVPPPAPVDAFGPVQISEEPPPVLYMGNLDAYQNLDFLNEVMRRVRAVRPDARLFVASHTAARAPADAESVMLGDFDSLRDLLGKEAVVVIPRVSWSGYPIKLVNAMAAGQAIVACRSAAHCIEHEVNGLVTPDNDAEAFAQAVLRLLAEPGLRRSLGEAARRTARELHAPGIIALTLEDIYRKVLSNRARVEG